MPDSIGKVQLDLETNAKPFQNELKGIAGKSTNMVTTAFSKFSKVFAAIFAVSQLGKFGKASIALASNLQEVQNVVDVVFGESSSQINNFAKNALNSYGLSELSAKKYASTMGAMLKSMGLSQKATVDMSQAITGLAGDMASFYNLDGDDAFNKIRAGISGETEPLKQLGINMSVANMEAFALSQGITKSYQSMTQSEQALLRYNYLLNTTSDAQGDFARTSGGWANQIRILKEQFNSFSATLGSVFMQVLAPVVRMLNWLIAKLQIAANYFKAFVEAITGVKAETSSASSGMTAIADSATEAGEATEKAAKKASTALAGFDKLNVLSSGGGDSDSGGSGGVGAASLDIPSLSGLNTAMPEPDTSGVKNAVNKVKGMFSMLKKYVTTAFAPTIKSWGDAFSSLKKPIGDALTGIGGSVQNLWKNSIVPFHVYLLQDFIPNAVNTFNTGFAPAFANATEKVAGSLEQLVSKTFVPFIEYVLNDYTPALSDNFNETIVPIFTEVMAFALEQFASDFEFTCQQTAKFVDDIFKPAMETMKTVTIDVNNGIKKEWDKSGDTLIEKFKGFFDSIKGIWTSSYEKVLKPIWDLIVGGLRELWDKHLKDLWQAIVSFISKFIEAVLTIWNNVLAPIIKWLVDTFGPIFVGIFKNVWDNVKIVFGGIIDSCKNVFKALGGLLDFITGVFSGNWKKAWTGIKTFFKGIWDSLVDIIKIPLNLIISAINTLLGGITTAINFVIKALNKLSFKVPDWVPGIGGKKWGFDIKELNKPSIPKLARGGIIDQPTLAMVGERGKEAVVPLENTAFADSIANAILRVLAPLFANGSSIGKNSDGTTVLVLKVGEYELGRITVGAINKYHNVIGKVELEV